MYFIKPNKNMGAFEVYCDMDLNGGGWTQIAKVGETLSKSKLSGESYEKGLGGTAGVGKCCKVLCWRVCI